MIILIICEGINIMKKIFIHFLRTIHALLYYAYTSMIKKTDNLWLFGAWKGTAYSDNSKYLFEYVCKEHPEIQAVWITKSKDIYTMLKNRGLPVELYPSHKAKYLISHARFLFQTEGSRDIGRYPVGGAIVIQLWHGIPAKTPYREYSKIVDKIISIESDNHSRSIWISTSDFYSRAIGHIYSVDSSHFINTGYPRCDAYKIHFHNVFIEELKKKKGYKAVALYLPTHRSFGQGFDINFIRDGFSLIDDYLEGKKVCLLYKPHPNEIECFKESGKQYKSIVILDSNNPMYQDVYTYLYSCDCLVSDYSSVIYDFLCINRPIVLFDYDLKDYREHHAIILEDYFNYPVGPICYEWEEMANKVIELLEKDDWDVKRKVAYEYFNKFSDGNSCKKVTDYVLSLISK